MNGTVTRCLIYALVILALVAAPVPVAAAPSARQSFDTLVITGASAERPYFFINEKGEAEGILVDYWKLLAEKSGIKLIFRPMEKEKSADLVKSGRAQVIAGMDATAEGAANLSYTQPLLIVEMSLFLRSTMQAKDMEDLKGMVVGIVAGPEALEYLEKTYPRIKFRSFPDQEELFKNVARGQSDAFIADTPSVYYFLDKEGLADRYWYVQGVYTKKIRAAVKEGNQDLLDMVNTAVGKTSNVDREAILDRWTKRKATAAVTVQADAARCIPYAMAAFALMLIPIGLLSLGLVRKSRQSGERRTLLAMQRETFDRELTKAKDGARVCRMLLEKSLHGICTIEQGRFTHVSPRFCEMLGYSADELLGVGSLSLVFLDFDVEAMHSEVKKFDGEAREEGLVSLIQARRKDGEVIDLESRWFELEHQGAPSVTVTLRDVTELNRTGGEVKSAIKEKIALLKELKEKTAQYDALVKTVNERVATEAAKETKKEQALCRLANREIMRQTLDIMARTWKEPLHAVALKIQDLAHACNAGGVLDTDYLGTLATLNMAQIAATTRNMDDFAELLKPSARKVPFDLIEAASKALSFMSSLLDKHKVGVSRHYEGCKESGHLAVTGHRNELVLSLLFILNNAVEARNEKRQQGEMSQEGIRLFFIKTEQGAAVRVKGEGVGLYAEKHAVEEAVGGRVSVYSDQEGSVVTMELFE